MVEVRCVAIRLIGIVVLATSGAAAQENAGKGLSALIQGNERFGRALLQQVHSRLPDRNVVISPISLTLSFAALGNHAYYDEKFGQEIGNVFGWGTRLSLSVPARQLLAAFEKPAKPKAK